MSQICTLAFSSLNAVIGCRPHTSCPPAAQTEFAFMVTCAVCSLASHIMYHCTVMAAGEHSCIQNFYRCVCYTQFHILVSCCTQQTCKPTPYRCLARGPVQGCERAQAHPARFCCLSIHICGHHLDAPRPPLLPISLPTSWLQTHPRGLLAHLPGA